jgi:hypothetical protein
MDPSRFWARIDTSGECWVWMGSRTRFGYGRFPIRGQYRPAHRIAWEMAHGPIPEGMCVCHTCDNPWCVNVDHLFLGTIADNNADMMKKGRLRNNPRRGMRHPRSHLTDAQVREMRVRYAAGDTTLATLATEYGVGETAAFKIVNRRNWKHVD